MMNNFNRLWALALCLLAAVSAAAQDWPTRPIQVIVPFPSGSVDAKARIVTDRVGKILGQPLVMINKPGAGMRIGTEQMIRSAPDGYTIGLTPQAAVWITPTLDPGARYSIKDMTLLSVAYESPMILVAGPASGLKSFDELLRAARTRPGKLNYAAPAGGSAFRIAFEILKSLAGVDVTFVPYRGLALALQDIMGGRAEVGFADFGSLPLVREGRLHALAVSSARRSPSLPEVPTLRELGIAQEAQPWVGFAAPRGLPGDVERRLVDAFAEALRAPDVRADLHKSGGADVMADPSPDAMRARIESELAEFRKNVKPGTISVE